MNALETCQRGCTGIGVDGKGRLLLHYEHDRVGVACSRSHHPSVEELARRKAKRAAKRAALVEAVRPEAAPALDAFIEGRPEFADRIREATRAALYAFNQAHRTRHRSAYATEQGETEKMAPRARCRFCGADIGSVALGSISLPARSHLTQCALEYLAELRHVPSDVPSTIAVHGNSAGPADNQSSSETP